GIRDFHVTGVQTCALPIFAGSARPYLYTTALPPPQAAAALASVKLARREHWRRERLVTLVQRFRSGMLARGFELPESDTPIQPRSEERRVGKESTRRWLAV